MIISKCSWTLFISVSCSTITVIKCRAALKTLQAFPFFKPTCLCREPRVDHECNSFRNFLFDHPCNFTQRKGNNNSKIKEHSICSDQYKSVHGKKLVVRVTSDDDFIVLSVQCFKSEIFSNYGVDLQALDAADAFPPILKINRYFTVHWLFKNIALGAFKLF